MQRIGRTSTLVPLIVAVVLAGCGGGGGGDSAPPPAPPAPPPQTQGSDVTVRGTVAVGAPLQGATVQFKCVSGAAQASTDAQGNYTATFTAVQFPCALLASGGRTAAGANSESLASLLAVVPLGADFANVTPLTHLLAARVFGREPGAAFAACCTDAAQNGRVTSDALTAAQAQVREQIRLKLGVEVPDIDWVRGGFSADSSNLMDQALQSFAQKRQQLGRTLAQLAGDVSSGTGEFALPNVAPTAVVCNPGLIAGYSGKFDDNLVRVLQVNPGDIGGGGGSSGGGASGAGAGGSEGQLLGVEMTVETRDPIAGKTLFGPVKTDAISGMATFVPCGYTGPALFTARGVAGSLYFDEARGGNPVSFENQTLRVAVESVSKNVGITRLTEAAYQRLAALNVSGSAASPVLKAPALPWHDVGRIALANNAVRAAVNDQLPSAYQLADITRLPVLIGAANAATPGVLTDNQNGVYGALLAGIAKTGAAFQPSSGTPALAIGAQLVSDLSDGLLNQRNVSTPVAVRTNTQAYSYSSLSSTLTLNMGATLAQVGQGALQTRKIAVQRVEAPVAGSATNRWAFTLLSDGSVTVVKPANTAAIVVPPFTLSGATKRIGRLDVVQRSAKDSAQTKADRCDGIADVTQRNACIDANNWDQCLSALSADGTAVFSWRVGKSAASFRSVAGGSTVLGSDSTGNALVALEASSNNPIVSLSPTSYDFGPFLGFVSMNAMALLQDGTLKSVSQCGGNDQHPGLTDFAARDITMSVQDGGNRYVLASDGTMRVWGLNASAMGIGAAQITAAGSSGRINGADNKPVLDTANGGASLGDVVMLTSSGAAYQPRALVRKGSDPALAGTVVVWGTGIPQPKPIPGLSGICWIAGPYAVGCDGRLIHVAVSAGSGGTISAVQTAISSAVPIWRVKEESVPNTLEAAGGTQTARTFQAVARDGSVYRLSGTSLTKVADAP